MTGRGHESNGTATATATVTVNREADTDPTAPTLTSASVGRSGGSTTLRFSEDLDLTVGEALSAAARGAFSRTVNGVAQDIVDIRRDFLTANALVVYHSTIYSGQTVVVSYDKSVAGGAAITDSDGDEVASCTTGQDGVPAVVNESTQEAPVSTDATLSDLVVHDGSANLTLTPLFASGTTTYTAMVANAVAEVTVTPTLNDSGATIEYLDGDDATLTDAGTADGHQVALAVGDNVIKVKVTAEDGNTTETYTVTVTRAAAIPPELEVTLQLSDDLVLESEYPVTVTISATPVAPATADVTVTLTTRRNSAPVADIDLNYYWERGETATRGDDYTPPSGLAVAAQGVLFATVWPSAFSPNAAGTAWVAERAFTIGIIDDQHAEMAETIVFTVESGPNRTSAQTITIRDNDAIGPGRPTGLQAAPTGQTRIQLSWTAPAAVGSFAITGYTIEVSENAGATWNVLTGHTGSARTDYRHAGLSAGERRHYRVSAISAAGTSAPSNVASATTMAAGPAATNPVLPPPQDVNATPILPGEIRLGWWRNPDEPSKDLVDRHQYRYRVRNASTWTVDWTTVNQTALPGTTETRNYNSVLLKGLTARTTYEFQVRSVDKGGRYSEAVSALGTAVGGRTIWIQADTRSVEEGAPLRFTLSRDQRHGRLMVILRISETGDMLPPGGRTPEGYWHEQVHFGDGNETIPLVLETVNDRRGPEPNSVVTVEVLPSTRQPHPDNELLYEVLPDLGSATITVTAAVAPTCTRNPGDLWCGVVTVGRGSDFDGYRTGIGHLSDTMFSVGTNLYTVTRIYVAGQTAVEGTGDLTFSINPRPGTADQIVLAQLTLDVDNDAFNLNNVKEDRPGLYYWSGAGLDWSEEDYVIARLREDMTASAGTEESSSPLMAAFEGLPEAHDGETAFTFCIVFSEAVTVTPEAMRTRVLTVAGGAVTGAARVDGEPGVWGITVTPDTREALSITLAPTVACEADSAVCTADGRALSIGAAHLVSGPGPETPTQEVQTPLTARFEGVPAAHDGEDAFTVTGGRVTGGGRVDDRRDLFEMTVEPDSDGAVTIKLPAGRECATSGAICTKGENRRQLTNGPSATVKGPAARYARLCSALGIGEEMTRTSMVAAFWEDGDVSDDRLAALDSLGNGNGGYDLGDMLAWAARCRGGEASGPAAGSGPPSPPPALPASRPAGGASRRRKGARGPARHRRTVPDPPATGSATRRSGWLRTALLAAVISVWGCGDGIVDPRNDAPRYDGANAAVVDPGPLHVRLTAPAQARDIGAMLVVEGPAIDSLQAPGLEMFETEESSSTRREVIIAGGLPDGPLLQVWVAPPGRRGPVPREAAPGGGRGLRAQGPERVRERDLPLSAGRGARLRGVGPHPLDAARSRSRVTLPATRRPTFDSLESSLRGEIWPCPASLGRG